MCRSSYGDDNWKAFACVGGLHSLPNVGPLKLPDVGTPTGSFFELGGNRGYGKIMIPGDDSALYLAVNTAAKPSLPPAQLEAAFINPGNWTWHDGTAGLASNPILEKNGHDLKECWMVSTSQTDWIIIYDGKFGGSIGLGYATLSAPLPPIEVDIDIKPGSYPNAINLGSHGLTPVAIFSDKDFDASNVNPATVTLADAPVATRGKNRYMAHREDVDGDGTPDMVVQIITSYINPACFQRDGNIIFAPLTGQTYNAQCIEGFDEVTIVPD
jgi:hypothetical protein